MTLPMHVGWLDLHPDASMNFQLNRWLAYGGESWLADVRPVLANLQGFDPWRDNFVVLGAGVVGPHAPPQGSWLAPRRSLGLAAAR